MNVDYIIKSGEVSKSKENSLTLEDATHALIVQKQEIDLTALAKREIGEIWEKLDGKNYTSLFNTNLDASKLWKTVKLLRKIDGEVIKHADFYGERGKGYAVHGNIFIAMQTYSRLNLNSYYADDFDDHSLTKNIATISGTVFSAIYYIGEQDYEGSYLAHLFRNSKKCRDLSAKLGEPIARLMPYVESFTMDLADKTLKSQPC